MNLGSACEIRPVPGPTWCHVTTEARTGWNGRGPPRTILSGVPEPGSARTRAGVPPASRTGPVGRIAGPAGGPGRGASWPCGLHQAWHDSPTFDEPSYVAAGLSLADPHDLRINPEHPPLAKALAALPALAAHPVIPRTAAWHRGDERVWSAEFLQAQLRAGTLQRVMFAGPAGAAGSRPSPPPSSSTPWPGACSADRRAWRRRWLWLAGPLVLGLGHLDGIDLPFTLATLLVEPGPGPRARGRPRRSGGPAPAAVLGPGLRAGRRGQGHRPAAGRAGPGGGGRLGLALPALGGRWSTRVVVGLVAWAVHLAHLPGDRPGLGRCTSACCPDPTSTGCATCRHTTPSRARATCSGRSGWAGAGGTGRPACWSRCRC